MNNIKLITIIVIISIIISLYWVYPKDNKENRYWTIDEVLKDVSSNIRKKVNREKYLVKDKVLFSKEVKIPKYSIKYFEETETSKEGNRFVFNTNESISIIALEFQSQKGELTYFTNNNYSFIEGEYNKFSLPINKYIAHNFYQTNSDYWKTVEPAYLTLGVMSDYLNYIITDDMDIFNISKNISINNQTKSFQCNLTFNSVSDFHPFPVKWIHIKTSMGGDYFEENFEDYYMGVYSENTYLGNLDSYDTELDKFIEDGDRVEISVFNYTGSIEYVPIQLESSHPSDINYNLSSPFPITPRFDIYLEGEK
ncbi:MAG: hypothetical protein R6U61_00295 [Thermoplasmata archaeon]